MILAATPWVSNAHLIEDVAALGFIRPGDIVLDPTYGRGGWWRRFRPELLIQRDRKTHPEWDFRKMDEFDDGSLQVIAFDPPYVSTGGRKTSTIPDFNDRYGIPDVARTPSEAQIAINQGINASKAKLCVGGTLLVKCKNYISSGKLFPGAYYTWQYATGIGLRLDAEFIHLRHGAGLQPPGRRQVHPRNNTSVLFAFRKVSE